jgi:uncharacterized membrane protein
VPDPTQHRGRGLRVFGHPAHAALAAFPIALLSVSVVADAAALFTGDPFYWRVSFWAVAAGLVAAVPTAGAGMVDLMALGEDDPAMKTGTTHMSVMVAAVGLFVVDVAVRGDAAPPGGMALYAALALDGVGAVLLMVGGWYGGELVFGHGVGRTTTNEGARGGAP